MGAWSTSGSHLSYSVRLPGNEDPNKPPLGFESKPGDPKTASDGHTYATWLVKVYIKRTGLFSYKLMPAPATDEDDMAWQEIIDWSQQLS